MTIDVRNNFGKVTVSTGYDAIATSIVLTSGHGAKLPSSFSYNLVWYNSTDYPDPADDPKVEIVRVTNRVTDTLTVIRAQESTSATTKNTAAKTYKMALAVTKKMIDDIETDIAAAGSEFGDGGENGTADRTLGNTDNFDLGFKTNNVERIHIDKGGNVGIALTGTIDELLHLGVGNIRLSTGQGIRSSSGNLFVAGDTLIFTVSDFLTERMRLDSNGLGVNYTTPSDIITLDGNVRIRNSDGRIIGLNTDAAYIVGTSGGAAIRFERSGSPSLDEIAFETHHGASSHAERLRIDADGNLKLMNASIVPSSSPVNAVQIYAEDVSASSELKVRDEASNITTLSPHNFSLFDPDPSHILPFSYYSKNPYIGKEINVDMYGAIKEIEALSGKQFIYTKALPPDEVKVWASEQTTNIKKRVDHLAGLEMLKETEITKQEAIETQEVTREVETLQTKIEHKLNKDTGEVEAKEVPVIEYVKTGQVISKIKKGVSFDKETGKFYRKKTREEAIATVVPPKVKQPPQWLKDRGV